MESVAVSQYRGGLFAALDSSMTGHSYHDRMSQLLDWILYRGAKATGLRGSVIGKVQGSIAGTQEPALEQDAA